MTRVILVPIAVQQAPLRLHALVERRTRVRGEYVERRRLDSPLQRPVDSAVKHGRVIVVHPEHKAAVHHHAQSVQSPDRRGVVAIQVLKLPLLAQIGLVGRLQADEQTA